MDDGIAVGVFVDGALALMRKRAGRVVPTMEIMLCFLAHYYDCDFDDCVFIIEILFVY